MITGDWLGDGCGAMSGVVFVNLGIFTHLSFVPVWVLFIHFNKNSSCSYDFKLIPLF